jgi:hypothetical protein
MSLTALVKAAQKAIRKGGRDAPDAVRELRSALRGTPQRSQPGYKLFRFNEDDSGQVYPLFADADTPVPREQWQTGTMGGGVVFTGSNGQLYVPGKVGTPFRVEELPEESQKILRDAGITTKWVKGLAARPGWHGTDLPFSHHIGGQSKGSNKPDYRRPNEVWAEVDFAADLAPDWQLLADQRAHTLKSGKPDAKTAHIQEQLPGLGYYRYKTNPNMVGDWMIGGDIKVNRFLTDEEVAGINQASGVSDLPRRGPTVDRERLERLKLLGLAPFVMGPLGAIAFSPGEEL